MYVCICNEVTDKQIRQATNKGVRSMKDLRKSLNVASTCGQCSSCAKSLLKEYLSTPTKLALQTI